MPKYFTLTEAQALLPQLEQWLRAAISAKQDYEHAENIMDEIGVRIRTLGGIEVDLIEAARAKAVKVKTLELFEKTVKQIEDLGCLVKDLDAGLIDFPALLEGEEVYLCWKLGEGQIGFWHHVEDGMAGRKPIAGEFDGGSAERPN